MTGSAEIVTSVLAWLALASHVGLVVGVVSLVFARKRFASLFQWIANNAAAIVFVVALGATLGSFVYSNIFQFIPCDLCWYQRIFLFPQVVILGIALVIKDKRVVLYSLALSLFGLVIALYHWSGQLFGTGTGFCSSGIDCSKTYFLKFDYITIPMLSVTTFAIILFVLVVQRIVEKGNKDVIR